MADMNGNESKAVNGKGEAQTKRVSPFADTLFLWLTGACSFVLVLLIGAICIMLLLKSAQVFSEFGASFITSQDWNAATDEFGAASALFGTLVTSFIAMIIAVPLSLVIGIFLVELAHPVISRIMGTAIELLAAIPSIVFGMWGLFVFLPIMKEYIQPILNIYVQGPIDWFCVNVLFFWMEEPYMLKIFEGPNTGLNFLSAGLILAVMVLPFISSVIRDVMTMVPKVVKESAHGVGATSWEVTRSVTFKYGLSGIIGGTLLGLGRALGETMAVTYVVGGVHSITSKLYEPGNTIASALANEFNEAAGLQMSALYGLGLILFVITVIVQLIFHYWLKRVRSKTGVGL